MLGGVFWVWLFWCWVIAFEVCGFGVLGWVGDEEFEHSALWVERAFGFGGLDGEELLVGDPGVVVFDFGVGPFVVVPEDEDMFSGHL
jgi:hypothetical protein